MALSRLEQGEPSAPEAIESPLSDELTTSEGRHIKIALQTAWPPADTALSGHDCSYQASLDRNRALEMAELDFVARNQGVHLPRLHRNGHVPLCDHPWAEGW